LLSTFDRETARAYPELVDVSREPSRDNLARVLGEAFWLIRQEKSAGRSTELVFGFAGHGDVTDGGEGFVVLSDGTFTRSELLAQVVEASPADINHIVIDACASYFMVQPRGGGAAQSTAVPLSPRLLDLISGGTSEAALARTGVLLSTSSAVEVHESNELGSGVFSFLLRSALVGASDSNRDGRIEYGEAAAFITLASNAHTDARARLEVFARAPRQRPHAALLDLSLTGATHFLAVEQGSAVHLRVLDSRGVPYAELHSNGGEPVLLALIGNPYYVVQQGDREAVLLARKAGAVSLSSLTFDAVDQRRGHADASSLFTTPFSRAYLDGFVAASGLPVPRDGVRFDVPFAEDGAPPLRLPLSVLGWVTLGGAGVTALAAGGAVVGNQIAFQQLSEGYARTGVLDAELSLEVERWRAAATALSVGAVVFGVVGAGVTLWSSQLDDGTLEVR
jgi:hypothetical protein